MSHLSIITVDQMRHMYLPAECNHPSRIRAEMAFVVGLVWRQPQGWSESGGDAEPADAPDFRYSSDPLLRLVTKDQAGKVCILYRTDAYVHEAICTKVNLRALANRSRKAREHKILSNE